MSHRYLSFNKPKINSFSSTLKFPLSIFFLTNSTRYSSFTPYITKWYLLTLVIAYHARNLGVILQYSFILYYPHLVNHWGFFLNPYHILYKLCLVWFRSSSSSSNFLYFDSFQNTLPHLLIHLSYSHQNQLSKTQICQMTAYLS